MMKFFLFICVEDDSGSWNAGSDDDDDEEVMEEAKPDIESVLSRVC